jgi:hypothetical protein
MKARNLNYYDSTALEASAVVKSTPGTLFSLTGYNDNTASQYIQIHNAASLPADTAVPAIVLTVNPKDNFHYDLAEIGRWFSTGIVICNSSTAATKTIGGSDCWFNVQYE